MPKSCARRIGRCLGALLVFGGLLMGPCMFVVFPATALAQANDRVVQGKVELASGGMAKGAIVYIKNAKTPTMIHVVQGDPRGRILRGRTRKRSMNLGDLQGRPAAFVRTAAPVICPKPPMSGDFSESAVSGAAPLGAKPPAV